MTRRTVCCSLGRYVKHIAVASILFSLASCAVSPAPRELDSLLVYGEGFIFSVKEPDGWVGDTKHAAAHQANVLIHAHSRGWQTTDRLIRVRLTDKTDEKVEDDLAADMNGYRKAYSHIQFQEFAVSHPTYRTYSKLFFVPGQFYEYVAYINPGPASALLFSVAMNSQNTEATTQEMAAFEKVVSSLEMLKAPQPGAPANGPLPADSGRG